MLYKIQYQTRRVTIIIKLFSKFWERVERKIIKRCKNKIRKYLGLSITLETRKKILAKIKNWLIRNIKIKKIIIKKIDVIRKKIIIISVKKNDW